MALDLNQTVQSLKAQFAGDPKKTRILVVLAVVMVGVWVRLLLAGGKSSAAAATEVSISPELLAQSAPTAVEPAPGTPAQPVSEPAFVPPPGPASDAAVDISGASRELARDPFAADWRLFRPVVAATPTPAEGGPGLLERAKEAVRQQRERQRRRAEAIGRAAEALVLQSTLISSSPTAMINGRTYRTGEKCGEFKILKIEARRVLVVKDGCVIALVMP